MTVVDQDRLGYDAGGWDELSAGFALIEAGLDLLTGIDPACLSGTRAMGFSARIAAASSRLAGLRFGALSTVAATKAWAGQGSRSMLFAVASNEDASVGSVRAELALAQTLAGDLPLTAAALRAGRLSIDKAKLLARLAPTSEARKAALRDPEQGEGFLLAKAVEGDTYTLQRAIRFWGYRVDPRADDGEHRDAAQLHEIALTDLRAGTRVNGLVSDETGELLRTGFRAVTGVPSEGDTRTTAQRNAAALHTMARFLLDAGEHGGGAKVRPHLNVAVSYDTVVAAAEAVGVDPAVFTETGLPIPRVVLDRLACDSELSRVIFGPDSVVLDAGRTQRIVSPEQRRAVIARDRECARPGCHAPPRHSEVHHRIWWDRGGGTSVEDSVLLCFHHHDWVHSEDITITRIGDQWIFTDPHGHHIQ
jgi:hypothetical protein